MLSTLRQFLDLLLRRAGPSDLPASPRLLAGTFAVLLAVQGALAALLGASPAERLPLNPAAPHTLAIASRAMAAIA